ncbi:CKLF-like MARVEL transmembrane domain-containing protein 1 [Pipistrellus kuhlii]|uniref:CKLF like MARVEL transmembrane domain containing 1 n=1 Tax=Pipistrellus kuhlii TaxID=59472 RepID=A0A7J7UZV4_PIPKU|nr:CKLF-like MARVEL transmembrane domain-containing protein 1 [Pipistrellus kuhlii]KAF6318334.1 CKLF like MARVEL transmembrane domain containing 1 [Pipistrellus kuhlii]
MASYDVAGPEGGAFVRRGRSAPTKNQPKRSAASIHGVQPGAKGKAKTGPDQKLDESVTPTMLEGEAITEEEKEAIQKRAEGRTKVPPKFTDSIKKFFFSPTGALKIVRLGLLIGALTCFIVAEAQESFIAITTLEIFIIILFILIYMLTLHHLLTYIHWPLLDLINSFITTIFLLVVAILTMREKERRQLFYIGGALCLAVAIVCLVDATLVTKMVRNAIKKALGIEGKAAAATPAKEEPGQQQPQEPQQEPKSDQPQEPQQEPKPEPGKPPSPVSLEPAAMGS